MEEKKKSNIFKMFIPLVSLVLFALISKNAKGTGEKAE